MIKYNTTHKLLRVPKSVGMHMKRVSVTAVLIAPMENSLRLGISMKGQSPTLRVLHKVILRIRVQCVATPM